MKLLQLSKHFERNNKFHEWCLIEVAFSVDGVEQFRDLLKVHADFVEAVLEASGHPWLPRLAEAVGVCRWDLQDAIESLKSYAEWEVKDGKLFELPTSGIATQREE
jgi:hypothetical protein